MAIKPKKDTLTVTTSGNKTTKTWEYDDGSGSSVTTTNPNKKLDPGYGVSTKKMKKLLSPKKPTKADLKPTPRTSVSPKPKKLTGEAAAKAYQKSISPKGAFVVEMESKNLSVKFYEYIELNRLYMSKIVNYAHYMKPIKK